MAHTAKKRQHATKRAEEVVVGKRKTHEFPPTWLLVADGKAAQIYTVEPITFQLSPVPAGRFTHRDLPGKMEKMRTRAHGAVNLRQSPHAATEDVFVRMVAMSLERMAGRTGPVDLLIAAPPKAMAVVRKTLKKATRDRIALEVTHEWAHLLPLDMTRRLIKALIKVGGETST